MRGKGVYWRVMVEVKVKERASEARWVYIYFIILLYLMRFDFRSSQRVPHPPTRPFVVPLHLPLHLLLHLRSTYPSALNSSL
jgi:hypothetical protein